MKRMRFFLQLCSLFVLVSCILLVSAANGGEITAFGPKKYIRTTGAPNIYKDTFTAQPGEARLVIRNGLEGRKSNNDQRVTSGKVSLNGAVLFTHQDFKHQTYVLETPIFLSAGNKIQVELESKPGSFLVIEIIQTIVDPPKDLVATDLAADTSGCPDYIDLTVQISNHGEAKIPAGVSVAFYNGDPQEGGQFTGKSESTAVLLPTKSESISYRWTNPPSGEAVLFARVDDDGSGVGLYEEVDELNNITGAELTLCLVPPPGESSIAGKVIDAVNGAYLSDVRLVLHLDDNGLPGTAVGAMQSDAGGAFLFAGLAPGKYHITAAHEGYIDGRKTVSLAENVDLTDQDLVLSPVLADDQIRIVLTWGANPLDLEAHLTAPSELGCRYHCYYFDRSIPTANLDLDDRDGYGPETMTITDSIFGTYRYYVHDFTNRNTANSRWLSLSGAQVKVYLGNREPTIFNVPTGYGNVWHVFDMDGQTGEITPVDFMSSQPEPGKIDYPVITSSPVTQAYWDTPYTYQVRAIDPDNDPLLYEFEKAPDGMTIDASSGLIQWRPAGALSGSYPVTVKVTDGRCGEASQSYSVYVYSQPSANFTVSPCSGMSSGGYITFTWNTSLASTVMIDPGIGVVGKSGTLTVPSPDTPTLYTLTAFNDAALTKRTAPGYPSASFYFSPSSIYRGSGQSTTLYWATSCSNESVIDHDIGSVTSPGSLALTPTETTTYHMSVTNAALVRSYSATVYVSDPPPPPPPPPPTISFSISPTCNLTPGEPSTLSWVTGNATSVSISSDIGEVPLSGTIQVYPQAAGSYTLTATGDGGVRTRTVTFPNYPSVSFYYSGRGL